MTLLQAIILGIVQGLTEFLPVSSSGHLVLLENILGLPPGDLSLEVVLHLATLMAVCLAFRRRLAKMVQAVFRARIRWHNGRLTASDENLRLFFLLVVATVPAGLLGYLFEDRVEQLFSSPLPASLGLLFTGAVLFGTRWPRRSESRLEWRRSLIIGLAQALAIVPGISRSGATISAGIYSGIKQERAAEFSFLLSIPIILGAGLFKLKDIAADWAGQEARGLLLAGLTAGVFGFLAIRVLLRVIRKRRLEYFAYYCWAAGIAGLIWSLTR